MKRKSIVFATVLFFVIIFFHIPVYSKTMIQYPLDRNEIKKAFERFLTIERSFIQRGLNNAAYYVPFIKEVFKKEKLPQDLVWLPLIESGFSVKAYSRAGACGLWQFMSRTAGYYHLNIDFWADERRDPFKSTEKAAKLLKNLYNYYDNWELALAAYNAGMGTVNHAIKKGDSRDFWKLRSMGLLKKETEEYVPRFFAAAYIAENHEKYGFTYNTGIHFPEFEILLIKEPVDLTVLARRSGIKLSMLQFLNPELRRFITPFGKSYKLRVPREKFADAVIVYKELPKEELAGVKWHRVRSGETLSEIAEKYQTKVSLIKRINNITNSKRVFAGRKILVPVSTKSKEFEEETAYIPPKKGFSTQEINYMVRNGDTIWDIARRYRTDVEMILAVNGLSFESIIMPGDEIKLWLDTALQR